MNAFTDDKASERSPFHKGEQSVQSHFGHRDIERWGRKIIRPMMPLQHRQFYQDIPFLVASARDQAGRPWATLLEGEPGFARSPDDRTLLIDAAPSAEDPLHDVFRDITDLGLLGIELSTRRRNRVNGKAHQTEDGGLFFKVDQSFGNCPQYIREREWSRIEHHVAGHVSTSADLTSRQIGWISSADTLFIASGYRGDSASPEFGMDASHRGGEPGFIEVLNPNTLRFPDYAGNKHYNTLGNLLLDPRAGFLFIDFESGDLLQLTGRTTISWEPADLAPFPGAESIITLEIDAVVEQKNAVSLRWEKEASSVRTLKVVNKTEESEDVISLTMVARDGGRLPRFAAGQHLPIELPIPGEDHPLSRTYSLSNIPNEGQYRITVKKVTDGRASSFLHDSLEVGAFVQSRRPRGDFVLPTGSGPLVLISAGVGITPMVSMLGEAARTGRSVHFFHVAANGRHAPLGDEVRRLAISAPRIRTTIHFTKPDEQDRVGIDYDVAGRPTTKDFQSLIVDEHADYMICGTASFMGVVIEALEHAGVNRDHIHTESFGPAGG